MTKLEKRYREELVACDRGDELCTVRVRESGREIAMCEESARAAQDRGEIEIIKIHSKGVSDAR